MVPSGAVFDCEVVHVSTTPLRHGDHIGIVTDGVLQLDARVFRCEVGPGVIRKVVDRIWVLKLRFSDGTLGEAAFDSDDELGGPVTALFLKQDRVFYYFLLVRQSAGGQVVRIGMGRVGRLYEECRIALLVDDARKELTTIY